MTNSERRLPVTPSRAGRGVRPGWMMEQLKKGKEIDDFLIDKSARKRPKNRKSKR
jgi:hypothetical protein